MQEDIVVKEEGKGIEKRHLLFFGNCSTTESWPTTRCQLMLLFPLVTNVLFPLVDGSAAGVCPMPENGR